MNYKGITNKKQAIRVYRRLLDNMKGKHILPYFGAMSAREIAVEADRIFLANKEEIQNRLKIKREVKNPSEEG